MSRRWRTALLPVAVAALLSLGSAVVWKSNPPAELGPLSRATGPVTTLSPDPATVLPAAPTAGPSPAGASRLLAALPEAGIAVLERDRVLLLAFDGTELGSLPRPTERPEPGRTRSLVIGSDRVVEVATAGASEGSAGCDPEREGGSLRVALCGGEPHDRQRVELVSPDHRRRALLGPAPDSAGIGHWVDAIPSPDGRWILAQVVRGVRGAGGHPRHQRRPRRSHGRRPGRRPGCG